VSNEQTIDADEIHIGEIEIHYLVDGSARRHSGMYHMSVPAGSSGPPPHSHQGSDEVVYILKGRLRYSVAGVERDLAQGDSAFCPRGMVHTFSNPFGDAASVLTVLTPDIGAQYFREVAAVINAGGQKDHFRLLEVMARHGVMVADTAEA
jgi:quercetin dioxygenase-like cupin family protein